MDNEYTNELQHWGVKGQRWGHRRYQNKDGTLTELGKKRYNKTVEKLKAEEEKIAKAEKIAANKKKTQAKIDKLTAKEQELEARKKALKAAKKGKDVDDKNEVEETLEERRERVLNSTDPKEIYKNKDILTYNEINDRINRIDIEARLQSRIPPEPPKKSIMDKVDSAGAKIGKVTDFYKKIDGAYSAFTGSSIGKKLAKSMGLDVEKTKPRESLDDFLNDIKNKSNKEIKEFFDSENQVEKLRGFQKSRKKEADKEAEESRKEAENARKEAAKQAEADRKKAEQDVAREEGRRQYEKFQERYQNGEVTNEGRDVGSSERYAKKGKDVVDRVTYTRERNLPAVPDTSDKSPASTNEPKYEKREKVKGEWRYYYEDDMATGKNYIANSSSKMKNTKVSDSDIDIEEPEWYKRMKRNGML